MQESLLDSAHAHLLPVLHFEFGDPSCVCSCINCSMFASDAFWEAAAVSAFALLKRAEREREMEHVNGQKSRSSKETSHRTLTVSLSPSEPLLELPCRDEYTQL